MYEDISIQAAKVYRQNKELVKKLKRKLPVRFDEIVRTFQEEIFTKINCLDCANCCKTLGPRISDKDIGKLSRHLKIKPSDFTHSYLRLDEDGDYVFKTMPCPFLRQDNFCCIYDDRPSACKDYPHLDRKRIYQVLDLSLKNSFVCPVVLEVFERMRKEVFND